MIAKCTSILEKKKIYSAKDVIRFPMGNKVLPAVRAAICYTLYHHYGFKQSAIAKAMNVSSTDSLRSMMNRVTYKVTGKEREQYIYKAICDSLKVSEVYSSISPPSMEISKLVGIADEVVNAVSKATHDNGLWVTPEAIHGKERLSESVIARHCCFFILRHHYGLSVELIGAAVGKRNHATVVYANKVFPIRAKSELLSNAIYRGACEILGLPPRFEEVVEHRKAKKISDVWTRGGKKAVVVFEEEDNDDKDAGYIVPLNYSEEEKRTLKEIERSGGFKVISS